MSIFIEYILIDNIVMDYIILRLMEMTVGVRFGKLHKWFVCILGGVFALIMPLIMYNKLLLFLYRITTSIILVLCIKKYNKLKSFFVYYLMFFAYTFFAGGVCLGVIELLGIDYTMSSVVMYKFDFPFGVFAIVLIIILRIMSKVIKVIKTKLKIGSFVRRISLSNGECSVHTNAFIDSGNRVSFRGEGVSIISINAFMKLYKDIDVTGILTGKIADKRISGMEYIYIRGLGKSDKYLSFVLDSVEVDGVKYPLQRFALSWKKIGEFDVILHSNFIGGCYEKINSKTEKYFKEI